MKKMDFLVMTVEEIITWIRERMEKNQEITINMLKEIVSSCSVIDPIAANDAVTIFYSGGEDAIANMLADTDNSKIRLIRRTDAFELLSYKDKYISFDEIVKYAIQYENPTLSKPELESKMIDALYGVSDVGTGTDIVGEGFWTQISSRFAAETTGNAYSLCVNARDDRIFARDELKQWIVAANDDAKFGKYTKSELMSMDDLSRFYAIKEWTISDLKNAEVYVDAKGFLVGRSFKGTILEKIIVDKEPSEYALKITNTEYLKIIENMGNSELVMAINDMNLYFDKSGNIIGSSYKGTALERIVQDTIPEKPAYSLKYDLYKEIAESGNFMDVINASAGTTSKILITKTGNGTVTISRLVDILGEGINHETAGKVIENESGISGIKKIINSEQGIRVDFGDFTVEETELGKFETSNALADFEKYGNYTEYVTADGQVVNVSRYVNWRTNTFKIIGVVGTFVFTIESTKTLCGAISKAMDGDIRQANKEICGWAGAGIGAIYYVIYSLCSYGKKY